MAKRKRNNSLNIFLILILIVLISILAIKIMNNKDKGNDSESINSNNITDTTTETKIEKNQTKDIEQTPSNDEQQEVKNEVNRRGGQVTLELIGDEEVTIKVGSKYKDKGFKATYSDGSDASDEVEVDNSVDTSTAGVYTVSYYVGNSVVIRRVTVE